MKHNAFGHFGKLLAGQRAGAVCYTHTQTCICCVCVCGINKRICVCVCACVACKCFVCKTCNLILHGPWLSSQRTVGRKQWHGTVASSVNCKQLGSSSLSINRKMLSLTYCKPSCCYCTDISNVSSSINCRHCKTLSINLVFIDLTYTYLCWPTVLLLRLVATMKALLLHYASPYAIWHTVPLPIYLLQTIDSPFIES